MRRKTKVFLLIVFAVFIVCTIETVLKTKFVPSKNYGYEISEITKNISVSEKNVLIVNEALRLKFNEPYSQIEYKIPLYSENYDIKISELDVLSSSSYGKVTYDINKENSNIVVRIKNNGFIGQDNVVVSYILNKGEDYDLEKDSFDMVLFDDSLVGSLQDFSFNVTFPKVINPEKVTLLVGGDSESKEIVPVVNSNIVSGKYINDNGYKLVKGVSLNVEFEEGYFNHERNYSKIETSISLIYFIITLIFMLVWFLKGKDQSINAKPTFYPPEGFSPIEIGYWIDNSFDFSDSFFMILHWANEGYIRIKKLSTSEDTNGKTNYVFEKIRNLDINKPEHEKILFNAIFELGHQENSVAQFNTKIFREETDALFGTLQTYAQNVGEAEEKFNEHIKRQELESYDKDADNIFDIMKFLSLLIWTIAIYYFSITNAVSFVDYMPIIVSITTSLLCLFLPKENFYSFVIFTSPILLLVSLSVLPIPVTMFILLDIFFTAIVRKRTFKYNTLLGEIYGFRNIISKTRYQYQIKQVEQISPNYFYNVLPYALVLFKAKNWVKQFDFVQSPVWYTSMDGEGLNIENINTFVMDMETLCQEVLDIVNNSATADKKKESREGLNYVPRTNPNSEEDK